MIPIAGSAYTYAYAILGEIVAWIIGWDLILEYAVSNMSVAVGFSAYIQDFCDNLFGWHLPQALAYPPIPAPGGPAGVFNVPALLITTAGDRGAGARREGERQHQHHHGADQDRRHFVFLLRRGARHQQRQLASVRAPRFPGNPDRRVYRVLHLHRIRFGFDRGRGVPEPAKRSAASASSPP